MSLVAIMKGYKKNYLRKIKCLNYYEYGNYSTKCLRKKHGDNENKGEQVAGVNTSTKIDDLSKVLESDYFYFMSHFPKGIINEVAW